jgi:hypothetical protein
MFEKSLEIKLKDIVALELQRSFINAKGERNTVTLPFD